VSCGFNLKNLAAARDSSRTTAPTGWEYRLRRLSAHAATGGWTWPRMQTARRAVRTAQRFEGAERGVGVLTGSGFEFLHRRPWGGPRQKHHGHPRTGQADGAKGGYTRRQRRFLRILGAVAGARDTRRRSRRSSRGSWASRRRIDVVHGDTDQTPFGSAPTVPAPTGLRAANAVVAPQGPDRAKDRRVGGVWRCRSGRPRMGEGPRWFVKATRRRATGPPGKSPWLARLAGAARGSSKDTFDATTVYNPPNLPSVRGLHLRRDVAPHRAGQVRPVHRRSTTAGVRIKTPMIGEGSGARRFSLDGIGMAADWS